MNLKPLHAVLAAGATLALTAYAATVLGTVTGEAIKYTDEQGPQCCDRLTSPGDAATDLARACEAKGGSYFKNPRFSSSAYCGTHTASPGKGWKYYCSKAVEADCVK